MRSPQRLFLALLSLLALALLSFGCGGGGDEDGPPDLSRISTATPPETLPDPLIVSGTVAAPGGTSYTVQPGDSPSSIADQFGVSVDELMATNGITDPTALVVGTVLTIPGVAPGDSGVLGATAEPSATPQPQATQEPAEPTAAPPPSGDVYIVQDGDIPETIAAQFGITAEELMAANGITDPTSLQIGQELIIPAPSGG